VASPPDRPYSSDHVEYGSPAPLFALALAVVSGVLLAVGHYVGGAVTGVLAILLFALWQLALARGEHDRHTLW
jgi:hypothetical protein